MTKVTQNLVQWSEFIQFTCTAGKVNLKFTTIDSWFGEASVTCWTLICSSWSSCTSLQEILLNFSAKCEALKMNLDHLSINSMFQVPGSERSAWDRRVGQQQQVPGVPREGGQAQLLRRPRLPQLQGVLSPRSTEQVRHVTSTVIFEPRKKFK